MDKYLLEILKEVNTIIIPGLGALTITNGETGEIMFMSYLKHDDGKLSGHIAQKEGWEENEAKNLIAKYVREITTSLDQGDTYDMFQFGTFFKDGDEIDFKNWDQSSEQPSTTSTTIAPEVKEEKEVISSDQKPEEEPAPIEEDKEKEVEEIKSQQTSPTPEKKEEVIIPTPPEKITVETAEKIVETPEPQPEPKKELNILEKEEKAKVENKLNQLKEQQANKKEKKKRGAGFWILMIILLLLVGGGTYIGINYDSVKQHIPFLADDDSPKTDPQNQFDEMKDLLGDQIEEDEDNSEADNDVVTDEEITLETDSNEEIDSTEEEVVEDETETPIVEETPVTQVSSGDEYHLIAGAFSSEANANRLVEKLKNEGYPAQILPGGTMYKVSAQSFASSSEAQSALSGLKSIVSSAWVFQKP